jgi:hypothetical protein
MKPRIAQHNTPQAAGNPCYDDEMTYSSNHDTLELRQLYYLPMTMVTRREARAEQPFSTSTLPRRRYIQRPQYTRHSNVHCFGFHRLNFDEVYLLRLLSYQANDFSEGWIAFPPLCPNFFSSLGYLDLEEIPVQPEFPLPMSCTTRIQLLTVLDYLRGLRG